MQNLYRIVQEKIHTDLTTEEIDFLKDNFPEEPTNDIFGVSEGIYYIEEESLDALIAKALAGEIIIPHKLTKTLSEKIQKDGEGGIYIEIY